MDSAVERVLAEYNQRRQEESKLFRTLAPGEPAPRTDDLLISVGPEVGHFMNSLIKGAESRSILELGTSYGHSTVFLAEAARATGGKVISIDLADYKQDYARGMLQKAGLDSVVEFRCGDAHVLVSDPEQPYDFVLLDLWKDLYVSCFEAFYPHLARDSFVVADNMLQPLAARTDAEAYRRHIRTKPAVDTILLPIGQGIELSRFRREIL